MYSFVWLVAVCVFMSVFGGYSSDININPGHAQLCGQYTLDYEAFSNMVSALNGYDIRKGDPLVQGGSDPGLRNEIFQPNQETGVIGRCIHLADGITAMDNINCEASLSSYSYTTMEQFIEGTESDYSSSMGLQSGLEYDVSLDVEAEGVGLGVETTVPPAFKGSFSESETMRGMSSFFDQERGTVVKSGATCITHSLRLLKTKPPAFAVEFMNELFELNKVNAASYREQQRKFIKFIQEYGTHWITEADFGKEYRRIEKFSETITNSLSQDAIKECSSMQSELFIGVKVDNTRNQCGAKNTETLNNAGHSSSDVKIITKGSLPPADLRDWANQEHSTPYLLKFKLAPIASLLSDRIIYSQPPEFNANRETIDAAALRKWFIPMYLHYCKTMGEDCSDCYVDNCAECTADAQGRNNRVCSKCKDGFVEHNNACRPVCELHLLDGVVVSPVKNHYLRHDQVTFSCSDASQVVVGMKTNTCGNNGQWEFTLPVCAAADNSVDCGKGQRAITCENCVKAKHDLGTDWCAGQCGFEKSECGPKKIDQWVHDVASFSSEWGGSQSASKVIGESDVYGKVTGGTGNAGTWAQSSYGSSAKNEYIEVRLKTPVFITEIEVYEISTPGALKEIKVRNTAECSSGNGDRYRGHVHQTTSGAECQIWTQSARRGQYSASYWRQLGMSERESLNYCRNPSAWTNPWCPSNAVRNKNWENCFVTECSAATWTTIWDNSNYQGCGRTSSGGPRICKPDLAYPAPNNPFKTDWLRLEIDNTGLKDYYTIDAIKVKGTLASPADLNECAPNPCKNGGVCEVGVAQKGQSIYRCTCRLGFGGAYCDSQEDVATEMIITRYSSKVRSGSTLGSSSVQDILNSISYNVAVVIEVVNYLSIPMTDTKKFANSGWVTGVPVSGVNPGYREVVTARKASDTATGSAGTVSFQIGNDQRIIIMWSNPYSYDFHSNWMAIGTCDNCDGAWHHKGLYSRMYNKNEGWFKREKYYYANSKPIRWTQGRGFQVWGEMGRTHKAIIRINVLPDNGQELAPILRN